MMRRNRTKSVFLYVGAYLVLEVAFDIPITFGWWVYALRLASFLIAATLVEYAYLADIGKTKKELKP
jgi:hypothetical protein